MPPSAYGRGGAKAKTPPGIALMNKEAAAQARQEAGKNPSVSVTHVPIALWNILKPPAHPSVMLAGKSHPLNAGIVYTPATFAADTARQVPQIAKTAHQKAVELAHPSKQNPPSLGREIDALLHGSVGIPRMGEGRPTVPNAKVKFTPNVPRIAKGAETPATGGEAGRQVREGLHGANAARAEQSKLYSAERGRRAGAAEVAMQAEGGLAGYKSALGELKGELPKVDFQGFKGFDQHALDAMMTHIQQHPYFRPYEKIRAQGALIKATEGKVPTKSEHVLLQRAFGREVANNVVASIPTWQKVKNLGLEALNVPRAMMASFDLSAPFRQGLVVGVKYPRTFFKNFAPMVKAFGSERVFQGIMNDVYERPTYPLMQKAKLALTDIGEDPHGTPLSQREEQFMSNLAERVPIVGHGIRASDRAYTGFLNKTRADVFDYLVQNAQEQGRDTNDPKLLESIGRFVNSATGRGDLGALQKHAVTLNTLMFSPRLLASRLNFLNPVYYAKLDPFARKEALKAARNLVATMGAVLYLAKLGGAKVNADPRNADFAKIRIGDTRIDLAGGFQQPVRLLAQLFSGKVVSSTTGKTLRLGPQGPGKLSRRDILQRFFEAKLAPVPSLIDDFFKGTDFTDKPFSWKREVYSHMVPLLAQDAADLYNKSGALPALAGYGLGAFGVGLQTYSAKKPKPTGGTTYSGGSQYGNSGSYGTGSGYSGSSSYGR